MADWRSIEDVDENGMNSRKPVPHHLTDSSQRYCVMTIVAPHGTNQKAEQLTIRVHGCRETMAEANRWAKAIRDDNTFFDVFCLKTNAWAALPPNVNEIDNVNMTDGRVQAILDSHREHEKGTKREMVERLAQAHEDKARRAALKANEEFKGIVEGAAEENAAAPEVAGTDDATLETEGVTGSKSD
ncbi:hypothetical protein JKP88DRAFT_272843 [Tribonema minus]|uniref:Uncharacterized protein n=1 Tax=Tribonema minus TaxID=303371 RepID=A0A836CEP3_9STRA|nr:hypothetical protein JKP88DRAFT_272843 [Tribonema minus]